ncbi:MAG: DUF305 domain-containing protein [Salinisphaera sp.]|nr:DUF305 domain-containing protein [Salinisphaera sp.]
MSVKVFLVATGVLALGISTGAFAQAPVIKTGKALAHEQPFLSESKAAMKKMMAGMAIKPTGDVDKDFVDMMVPHHQGAIDMAILELRYGTSARLKAIAQEIVVTQQQEIAAMKLAVGEPIPPSHASPVSPDKNDSQAQPAKESNE